MLVCTIGAAAPIGVVLYHHTYIGPIVKLFIFKSIKRELKTRPIYDCRCDERLEPKCDEFTCLTYTGLLEELEYLKIETRLIDEKFASLMGECVM
jgi:hypothetical protein